MLHLAAMMGEAGTVRMLVEAGANTSLRDNEDRTPEVIATRFRRHEIADIFAGAQSGKFRRERQCYKSYQSLELSGMEVR